MVIHFSICIAPNIMKKILGNMLSISTSFLCIQKEAVYLKTRLIEKENDLAIENARINNGQKFSLDAKFLINLFFSSLSLSRVTHCWFRTRIKVVKRVLCWFFIWHVICTYVQMEPAPPTVLLRTPTWYFFGKQTLHF